MKRKIAILLCAAMIAGLAACTPEEKPQEIQTQQIGGEQDGAGENGNGTEDAGANGTGEENNGGDNTNPDGAQTAAMEDTYFLQNYEEDIWYVIDGNGKQVAIYSGAQAKSAFEREGINYSEDVSCRTVADGIGYFYTCNYHYPTDDGPTIHDYNFYAYDFDNDKLKVIYSVSTPENMESYDFYQGRVYLYFQQDYKYSAKVFDVDRDSLTFTEVQADNAAFLQAMEGWVMSVSVTGWVDYVAPERVLDQNGYVIACSQSWNTDNDYKEFKKINADGTSEVLPDLAGEEVYLRYAGANWVLTGKYEGTSLKGLNLTTGEVREFAGAKEDQSPQTLAFDGDKLYYYYAIDSETEYNIKHYEIYSYDWNTGENALLLENDTLPGYGRVNPGIDGFRVIGGVPYAQAPMAEKVEWVKIANGKAEPIGCPIREINTFHYGEVIYNTVKLTCPYCGTPLYGEYLEAFRLDDQYSAQAAKINEQLAQGLDNMDEHFSLPTDKSECEWHKDAEYPVMETDETYVKDVTILSDRFLGVYRTGYWYGGGAHGYPFQGQRLFDLNTGEEVKDVDLYTGTVEQFKTYVAEQTKKYYEEHPGVFFASDAEEAYNNAYESATLSNGYIIWGETSATYFFTPYELGPYSSGYIEIELPYDEFLGMDLVSALGAEHPAKAELETEAGQNGEQ
jgi:hypothetical protein